MDMLNRGLKILLAFTCMLAGHSLQAQSVRVKATANKDHILVGEPILLQLEAETASDEGISWFILDSISHFEIVDPGKIDTLPGSIGKVFRQSLIITSFDSGSQVIPQMAVGFNNGRFLTDSIRIEVGYSNTDPNQAYHDIKDIIEVPAVEPLYVNYILAVLSILAIVALVFLLRKRKPLTDVSPAQQKFALPPYEKAIAALADLQAAALPQNGQFKTFCITLNEILRVYCREERIGALPDTDNMRLVVELKPMLAHESLVALAQQLRLIDAVKFARYAPSLSEQEMAFKTILASVESIHQQHAKKPSA